MVPSISFLLKAALHPISRESKVHRALETAATHPQLGQGRCQADGAPVPIHAVKYKGGRDMTCYFLSVHLGILCSASGLQSTEVLLGGSLPPMLGVCSRSCQALNQDASLAKQILSALSHLPGPSITIFYFETCNCDIWYICIAISPPHCLLPELFIIS